MNIRGVRTKHVNNTWEVEGINVHGELQAADAAFRAGAAEFAAMAREKVMASDLVGLVELLKAAETNSFYQQPTTNNQPTNQST